MKNRIVSLYILNCVHKLWQNLGRYLIWWNKGYDLVDFACRAPEVASVLQTYQEEEEFLAVWKAADMSLVESWAFKVVEFLSTQTWVGTSPNSLIDMNDYGWSIQTPSLKMAIIGTPLAAWRIWNFTEGIEWQFLTHHDVTSGWSWSNITIMSRVWTGQFAN